MSNVPVFYAADGYFVQPKTKTKKIPRPMNAFMIFGQKRRKELKVEQPEKGTSQISVILGEEWKKLEVKDRNKYFAMAREAEQEHRLMYPGYQYKPRRGRKKSKNKMAHDESSLNSATSQSLVGCQEINSPDGGMMQAGSGATNAQLQAMFAMGFQAGSQPQITGSATNPLSGNIITDPRQRYKRSRMTKPPQLVLKSTQPVVNDSEKHSPPGPKRRRRKRPVDGLAPVPQLISNLAVSVPGMPSSLSPEDQGSTGTDQLPVPMEHQWGHRPVSLLPYTLPMYPPGYNGGLGSPKTMVLLSESAGSTTTRHLQDDAANVHASAMGPVPVGVLADGGGPISNGVWAGFSGPQMYIPGAYAIQPSISVNGSEEVKSDESVVEDETTGKVYAELTANQLTVVPQPVHPMALWRGNVSPQYASSTNGVNNNPRWTSDRAASFAVPLAQPYPLSPYIAPAQTFPYAQNIPFHHNMAMLPGGIPVQGIDIGSHAPIRWEVKSPGKPKTNYILAASTHVRDPDTTDNTLLSKGLQPDMGVNMFADKVHESNMGASKVHTQIPETESVVNVVPVNVLLSNAGAETGTANILESERGINMVPKKSLESNVVANPVTLEVVEPDMEVTIVPTSAPVSDKEENTVPSSALAPDTAVSNPTEVSDCGENALQGKVHEYNSGVNVVQAVEHEADVDSENDVQVNMLLAQTKLEGIPEHNPPKTTEVGQFKTPPNVPKVAALSSEKTDMAPHLTTPKAMDPNTPLVTDATPVPEEWSDFDMPARTPLATTGDACITLQLLNDDDTPPGRPHHAIGKFVI